MHEKGCLSQPTLLTILVGISKIGVIKIPLNLRFLTCDIT